MQDFKTTDRSVDAFRHSKTRAMVFVIPGVIKLGVQSNQLRFPWSGKLLEFYATCMASSDSNVIMMLQKCSQAAIDTVPVWVDVMEAPVQLDLNERSTKTSSAPYVFSDTNIAVDDHFRINILQTDEKMRDLTVEIVVQLK